MSVARLKLITVIQNLHSTLVEVVIQSMQWDEITFIPHSKCTTGKILLPFLLLLFTLLVYAYATHPKGKPNIDEWIHAAKQKNSNPQRARNDPS